ncbi:MAG: Do family serine endopeptidase [Bdellovibrionales bacterium]|nr:Do family serine endopeptidase [Bdellovibrionales bacterium]
MVIRRRIEVAFFTIFMAWGWIAGDALANPSEGTASPATGEALLFHEDAPSLPDNTLVTLPNFAALARFAEGAVVNISSESGSSDEKKEGDNDEEEESLEDALPPFLRPGPHRPMRSLGSGFFISKEGYIVTNNHVVDGADTIIVRVSDSKTEYKAELIGADPKTDIALIKIDPPAKFVTLPLGNSDELQLGEWVLAVGNQFQLGQTFTVGVVSAKARKVPTANSGPYDQFIQTDASINPGSSGGPLINARGQVVGINTAIFSPGRQQFGSGSGFNIGIGFSVPVNLAKSVLLQLKKSGRVTRGLLGVIIQAVSPEIKEALGLKVAKGALVADVLDDTPASEVGFKREDVIIDFDGKEVEDHDDLPLMVANTRVGTRVKVTVVRSGKNVVLTPTIGELSDAPRKRNEFKLVPDAMGLIVEEMTSQYAHSLGLSGPHGVVVAQVEANSRAEKAGVLRGDVIEELDRQPIRDVDAYDRVVKKIEANKVVLILVRRKEGTRFLTMKGKE